MNINQKSKINPSYGTKKQSTYFFRILQYYLNDIPIPAPGYQ
jgi:hypothetical protein